MHARDVRGPGIDVRGPGIDVRGPGFNARGPGVNARGPGFTVLLPTTTLHEDSIFVHLKSDSGGRGRKGMLWQAC